jgi:glycosyltransferase involved in cell wall biosynthesis
VGAGAKTLTVRENSHVDEGPLVTIVVPTYNRADLIKQAIQSVLDQSYGGWELVVVDDGSDDRTVEYLEALDERRLKILQLDHCGNVARLRNLGAGAGTGQLIAFLDSDDIWDPQKLETQVSALGGDETSWCYGDHALISEGGERLPLRAGQFRPLSGRIAADLLRFETGVSIDTLLVPRGLFDRVGGFDEGLAGREDLDLVLRLAEAADAVAVPKMLAWVRDHKGRTTSARRNNDELMANVFRKALARSRDPVLMQAARAGWTSHLARAGGDMIGGGRAVRGATMIWRGFIHGAGIRHSLHCLASGVRRRWKAR